jgi:hypothetical protein
MATTPKIASASMATTKSQFWPNNFLRKGVMLLSGALSRKSEGLYASCDSGKVRSLSRYELPAAGAAPLRLGRARGPAEVGQIVKASVLLLNCKKFRYFRRDNRKRGAIPDRSNCLELNNLYSFSVQN